ncbi:MAG: type II secretion system secretin GspD [Kiritimatiellae bacterium]|nr:type II secretion system secretin GspD [Kiritimatiellia bacterium]
MRFYRKLFCVALVLLVFVQVHAADKGRLQEKVEGGQSEGSVNFTFDQVDVRTFVKLVGEITGKKFVVAEDVAGKITVVSPRITRKQVYPLFVSILESSGCSVVDDGRICRIITIPRRLSPAAPVVGANEQLPEDGLVTKVFRLEHVTAAQILRILEPKVAGGKNGSIAAVDETNHVLITDTADSIRRIAAIIKEIDQPGTARSTEIVHLKFVGAERIADQLNLAMSESRSRGEILKGRLPNVRGGKSLSGRSAIVVASPHSNSLILVGSSSKIQALKKMISQMDIDPPSGRGRLNAIFLNYISAEDAAKSITSLLGKSASRGSADKKRGSIAIEASIANNALLVDAATSDFEEVRRLVTQLDKAIEQVFIEVVIAELSVTDSLEFGVDMAVLDMDGNDSSTTVQGGMTLKDNASGLMNFLQQGIFPRGMSFGVGGISGGDGTGVINIDALKKNSKFRIRSSPSLVAQNNKEASISIVNDIPILKSKIEGTGDSREVIGNIERMEVGLKLKLTPHIISGKEIRLVLNPSIEAVIESASGSVEFAPTIARREVSTTVTVPDGQTVVIAGLTREDKKEIVKKVPILGSIPLLGWFFRSTIDSFEKTEVLIFVTPRIIKDTVSARDLKLELEKRSGLSSHRNSDENK